MIKGLIFDMDGTFVPNIPFHMQAWTEQGRRHGYELVAQVTNRLFGWHNYDILPHVVPAEFIERLGLEYLSDEKEAIYRELYAGNVVLTEGLKELLQDAKRCDVKCFVGSAAPRVNVEFVLEESSSAEHLAGYICADDVTHCKPHPEIFLSSCERMGLQPSECVVFEDAISGIKAGVAAGCHVVGISSTAPAEVLLECGAEFVEPDFRGMTIESLSARLLK
ncbi:MAG: HAD family phosphatase [Alistipes sp.]|jgi:HAD superfamily hydrolase (TIGR01509 family)|nr:HAD family phosphatase [Alistipes sp.]